jgi:hypothetical protein
MYRLAAILGIFLVACLSTIARSEEVIVDKKNPMSSRVSIVAGGWDADIHADATYRAFVNAHPQPLGRYDFYYSLEIVPQFNNKYSDCADNPNFNNFFKALFGVTNGVVLTVKADIQQRLNGRVAVDLLKGDSQLVLAARGASSGTATAGNGCFFDETLRPTFPMLQWNGGSINDEFDDFRIKFIVTGGKTENIAAVQNLVSLFSSASAAAGWASGAAFVAAPAFAAEQKVAQNFQSALQTAGTLQNQVSKSYVLKAFFPKEENAKNGKIAITIPSLFDKPDEKSGNLVIYVRRHGSIVLQGSGQITPQTVFDSVELANRQCNMVSIAGGSCTNSGNDSLRISLEKALKTVDGAFGDGTNPIAPLLDYANRPKSIYNVCKAIRTVSRLQLHLSTLDEMLIRWAFTKEAGIQDEFDKAANNKDEKDKFEAATGQKLEAIQAMCWNKGDKDTVESVAHDLKRDLIH